VVSPGWDRTIDPLTKSWARIVRANRHLLATIRIAVGFSDAYRLSLVGTGLRVSARTPMSLTVPVSRPLSPNFRTYACYAVGHNV
jgi:hypothetical protein